MAFNKKYSSNIKKSVRKKVITKQSTDYPKFKKCWFEGEVLHVCCWDGVGDIWWVYSKLNSLNIPIKFHIYRSKFEYPKRAHLLLDLLDNVTYNYNVSAEMCADIYKWPFPKNCESIIDDIKKGTELSLCPNSFMESGLSLKDIWPSLKLNYKTLELSPAVQYKIDSTDKNTLFVHPATYGPKSGWVDLNDSVIHELLKKLIDKNIKIGLCGGSYDKVDWNELTFKVKEMAGYYPISLIGESVATCIGTLKNSLGWVGPINGLSILGLTQGVNVFTLWPTHLKRMIPTIVNPKVKSHYGSLLSENLQKNSSNLEVVEKIMEWVASVYEAEKNEYNKLL